MSSPKHENWSSRWAFIFAATGAAVGLGNIWKFPYITGENGGGAFVLVYLICIIAMGLPLLMAEVFIGYHGQRNPVEATRTLALAAKRSRHWQWVGALIMLAGFLILTYYSVIAGWALDYIFQTLAGHFVISDINVINQHFEALVASPGQLIFWHTLVMLITGCVIVGGVQKGIERAIYVMFPGMLILLFVLIGYAMQTGHFTQGLHFLFDPDFSKLNQHTTLVALGHAFFTLSLATGSIMMYGAYLPKGASVAQGAISIAIADTVVALLSGMAIFPVVFANNLTPSAGAGLIFKTLPLAFSQMAYGQVVGVLFFVMLSFAALTSAISLIEPPVAFLIEKFAWTRSKATLAATVSVWLLGFATVFSFNHWSHISLIGLSIFDFLDHLTANILLPLGGLAIAIFTAWVLPKEMARTILNRRYTPLFQAWYFAVRYITPVAIVLIFLNAIGVM